MSKILNLHDPLSLSAFLEKYQIETLSNTYYLMRHGLSEANQLNMIVSWPENGTLAYGLTLKGRSDIIERLTPELKTELSNKPLTIICSPFLRTVHTANLVQSFFPHAGLIIDDRLQERNFGVLEKTDSGQYRKVWNEDEKDPGHHKWNVESVVDVIKRLLPLLVEIENHYSENNILCISHGDICNILFTLFENRNHRYHHKNYSFSPGEIKRLKCV